MPARNRGRPAVHRWRGCSLLLMLLAAPLAGAQDGFQSCVAGIAAQAVATGLAAAPVQRLTAGRAPLARVIELDRRQPESTLSFAAYRRRLLDDGRVERGRRALQQFGPSIRAATADTGVPAELLVALWGLETDYGRVLGGFDSLDALLTLACDDRRPAFFRGQALDLLHLLASGRLAPGRPQGSWAGAMGQLQFLPGLLRRHGVDLDGDGRVAIDRPSTEVFATAARFLADAGWQPGAPWGWRLQTGDRPCDGGTGCSEPAAPQATAVREVRFGGEPDAAFALGPNAEPILRWNRADYYVVVVGLLFDRLREPDPLP